MNNLGKLKWAFSTKLSPRMTPQRVLDVLFPARASCWPWAGERRPASEFRFQTSEEGIEHQVQRALGPGLGVTFPETPQGPRESSSPMPGESDSRSPWTGPETPPGPQAHGSS